MKSISTTVKMIPVKIVEYACDGVNMFTCTCAAGYTGATCGTEVDECDSNPCQNGGLCTDNLNSFTCSCSVGFTGDTCQDVDDCLSNPCQNGGTCIDGDNSYTCQCGSDAVGITCQFGNIYLPSI